MAIADAAGFPVAAHVESASPHEVKLVEATIDSGFTQYAPDRLVGDKAYDSDGLVLPIHICRLSGHFPHLSSIYQLSAPFATAHYPRHSRRASERACNPR